MPEPGPAPNSESTPQADRRLRSLNTLPHMITTVRGLLDAGSSFSLCICDVRSFAAFNASHGYARGDLALDEIAAYLAGLAARICSEEPVKRLVYRIRGDEFALVLPGVSADEVCRWLQVIHTDLYENRVLESDLALSVGAASAPVDGHTLGHLWLAAEARLMVARHAPKDEEWPLPAPAIGRPCGFNVGPPAGEREGQVVEARVLAGEPERLAGVIDDLMIRVEESERLRGEYARMAYTDLLTSLPNQRAFNDHLGGLIEAGTPFLLMLIDGDGLKAYNRAFGYAGGDRMIRRLARLLRDSLPSEAFLARWLFGDEFMVVMEESEGWNQRAADLRKGVRRGSSDWELPVTISVGLALFPKHGQRSYDLIQAAVEALQAAKAQHGDTQVMADLSQP